MRRKYTLTVLRLALKLRVKPELLYITMKRRRCTARKAATIVERAINQERERNWEHNDQR